MDLLHGRNIDKRNGCSVLSGVLSSVRRNRTSALFFGIMAERIGNCRIVADDNDDLVSEW